MSWFQENTSGHVFEIADGAPTQIMRGYPHTYTEVADAQGTPLNAGSGTLTPPSFPTPLPTSVYTCTQCTARTKTPAGFPAPHACGGCNARGTMIPVQNAVSGASQGSRAAANPGWHPTCPQDHKAFAKALRDAGQPQGTCYYCGEELGSAVAAPKQKDDGKEAELLKKVIPAFNGERLCSPPKPPTSTPKLPYFVDNKERNYESYRQIKRHLSVAMREWPICRHSREPLQLRIEGRPLKDDPYGGEYAAAKFFCPTCMTYGEQP